MTYGDGWRWGWAANVGVSVASAVAGGSFISKVAVPTSGEGIQSSIATSGPVVSPSLFCCCTHPHPHPHPHLHDFYCDPVLFIVHQSRLSRVNTSMEMEPASSDAVLSSISRRSLDIEDGFNGTSSSRPHRETRHRSAFSRYFDAVSEACTPAQTSCFGSIGAMVLSSANILWSAPVLLLFLCSGYARDLAFESESLECIELYSDDERHLLRVFSRGSALLFFVVYALTTCLSIMTICRMMSMPFLDPNKRRELRHSCLVATMIAILVTMACCFGILTITLLSRHCSHTSTLHFTMFLTMYSLFIVVTKLTLWLCWWRHQPSDPSQMSLRQWRRCLGAWICCFTPSKTESQQSNLEGVAALFIEMFNDVYADELSYITELIHLTGLYQKHRRKSLQSVMVKRGDDDGERVMSINDVAAFGRINMDVPLHPLSFEDRSRFLDARYHVGHFWGAYGWRLRAFTSPCNACDRHTLFPVYNHHPKFHQCHHRHHPISFLSVSPLAVSLSRPTAI